MYSKLAVALLLGVGASVAHAAEQKPYAFATMGMSSYSGSSDSPIAFRVGGGMKVIENKGVSVSAEGAYINFGEAKNSYSNGFATVTAKAKTSGLMANAVVTYDVPNAKGLALLGKIGLMHASSDVSVTTPSYTWFFTTVPGGTVSTSSTANGLFFGFGLKYALSKELDVFGTYEDFGSVVSGLSMLSAGVSYKF